MDCSGRPRTLFVDLDFRDGNHELTTPFAQASDAFDNFVFQIPRENEQVVWTRLPDVLGRVDGDPDAGEKLPLLVGAAVNNVIHEIGSNAVVIQERVAFGSGVVSGNLFAALLGLNEEFEELALGFLNLLGKTRVGFELIEPGGLFASAELSHARSHEF